MFIWMIAGFLFLAAGTAGYYQGALRATISLIGLLISAALAVPASPAANLLLGIFGLEHPVLLAFFGPLTAFVLILICFKTAALATHRKVDTYFKYKASDTLRLLYERMNARIGAVIGTCNAFVYLILISVAIYTLGYFTMQVRTGDRDTFVIRAMSRLSGDLRETRMDKAIAAFLPKSNLYYDGVDVIATIFQNPLIQSRLSTYPPFLMLSESPDYKQIGNSAQFMEFWTKTPTLEEFRSHDLIKPMVESAETYKKMLGMLDNDPKDLKVYLETGKSPKYDEELILGRWELDGAKSFALAKKRITNPTIQQLKRLRAAYGLGFKDTVLIATVDKKLIVKAPNFTKLFPTGKTPSTGNWEQVRSGTYTLELTDGSNNLKAEGVVDDRKLTFTLFGFALVFEK